MVEANVSEKTTSSEWQSYLTPSELTNFAQHSSNAQIRSFVRMLGKKHPDLVEVMEIGTSPDGESIIALKIGKESEENPLRVLLHAQQHGDEPAGMEATLMVARDLLITDRRNVLDHMTVWIVPQINPDGARQGMRRTSNNVDLNRNHHLLPEPELKAFYKLFHNVLPHVSVDVHEHGAKRKTHFIPEGGIPIYDLMADRTTNCNVDDRIISLADRALAAMQEGMKQDGYAYRRYVPISDQGPLALIPKHSNMGIYGGRELPSILGTLAFITEALRFPELSSRLERRSRSTYSALMSLLEFAAANRLTILESVENERNRISNRAGGNIALRAEYRLEPQDPLFEYEYWQTRTGLQEVMTFEEAATKREVLLERTLPNAYWIDLPENDERWQVIKGLLDGHQIGYRQTESTETAKVESHVVHRIDPENWLENSIDVEISEVEIPQGSTVIPANQLRGHLAALLFEPESMNGIILSDLLPAPVGNEWPFRRVLGSLAE